jgi:peroxiredoxin
MPNGRSWLLSAMLIMLAAPAVAKDPKVGDKAPDFELTLIDGSIVRLSELKGQVVLLNFWATWCAPCKVELPILDGYYRLRRDAGLKAFAITTEGSLPLYKLKKVFALMAIPSAKRIKGPYNNLGAVPTNYVIDRSGFIRYAKAAALSLADLNQILIPLLKEPKPAN